MKLAVLVVSYTYKFIGEGEEDKCKKQKDKCKKNKKVFFI